MVASLQTLAKNTIVRDILFSGLLDRPLQTEDLHSNVSNEVLRACDEIAPDALTDLAILKLIHPHVKRLELHNLHIKSEKVQEMGSLLDLIFKKCTRVEELDLYFVHAAGLQSLSRYLSPRAENYTSISLASCTNIKDHTVKFILEKCVSLTTLDLSDTQITDQAFTDVNLPKQECIACGLKNNKPLNLSAVKLSGCSALTTTAIRRIVDLCGASLRRLDIAQCGNIYATALWYLCGLFQGKADFLTNEYTQCPDTLTCSCSMWRNQRNWELSNPPETCTESDPPETRTELNPHELSNQPEPPNTYIVSQSDSPINGDNQIPYSLPNPSPSPSTDSRTKISVYMHNNLENNDVGTSDAAGPSSNANHTYGSNIAGTSSNLNSTPSSHAVGSYISDENLVQQVFGEAMSNFAECSVPDVNIEDLSAECQGDVIMSELNDHYIVCNQMLSFHLGGYQPDSEDTTENSTRSEAVISEVTSSPCQTLPIISEVTSSQCQTLPIISEVTTSPCQTLPIISEVTTSPCQTLPIMTENRTEARLAVLRIEMALNNEMKKVKELFLVNQKDIRVILDSEVDDIPRHSESYQRSTKELILQSAHILILLDQYHTACTAMSNEEMDHNLKNENNGHCNDCTIVEETLSTNDYITKVRAKIVKNVQLLEQVNKEIKSNEQLKSRLRNLKEIEALQKSEIDALQEREMVLADRLSELRSHLVTVEHGEQGAAVEVDPVAAAEQVVQRVEHDIDAEIRHFIQQEVLDIDILEQGVDHIMVDDLEDVLNAEPPDEVNLDEENIPEILTLMASEVSLLLQQAKYFHCPSCCPLAYRPHIEELDVSSTIYQSEELARIVLKTFVTVNEGLQSLSVSWDCLDNETMEHVAQQSPLLRKLNIDQCENLSSPTLRSLAQHDLVVLSMHGVAWMQDTGLVPYLLAKGTQCSLTTLCLAEAYISDLSLTKLALYCQLTELNLSWCDDITDEGLALVITSSSTKLKELSVRQCNYDRKTLAAIALCTNLEKLDISSQIVFTEETFMPIATNLPKLRDLDVGWAMGVCNQYLSTLLSTCHDMRKLVLDGIKTISHEPFLPIVNYGAECSESASRSAQYQPRLRLLSLQYCSEMDDTVLQDIVNQCRGSLFIHDYYGELLEPQPLLR